MPVEAGLAAIVGGLASWWDLRSGQIPNWIPLAGLLTGLGLGLVSAGWSGLLTRLFAAILGSTVFAVFYLAGGLGGGDVKLIGALAAVVGVRRVLPMAFWTALIGGLWAAVVVIWSKLRDPTGPAGLRASIPYAPSIAAGALLSLLASG